MADVMQTHGVASFGGSWSAIIQGSTDTTFYVVALYFGSVGVKDTRHALGCALFAECGGHRGGDWRGVRVLPLRRCCFSPPADRRAPPANGSGRWGAHRSEIKEEAAGRGTSAEMSATPA